MDSNKLGNISSSTQRRRLLRPNLILLFSAVAAFVVHYSIRVLTEYTLCTHHEQIYTVNDAQPRAHCITIRNDRIHRIGAYGMSYCRTYHHVIPVEATSNWKMRSRQCQSLYLSQAGVSNFSNLLSLLSRLPISLCLGLLVCILAVRTRSDSKFIPIDAHAHVLENGWMMQLPLTGTASVQGRHPDLVSELCHPHWSPRGHWAYQTVYSKSPQRAQWSRSLDRGHGLGSNKMGKQEIPDGSRSQFTEYFKA